MILAAVVAASPVTMNLPPAMKANIPVIMVSSQKKPAILALKSGEDSVISEANGASMVFLSVIYMGPR